MFEHSQKNISFALLDDHPIIRHAFEIAAEREADISMTASFGVSRELLSWLKSNHPDVLVLDYLLDEELDGLSLIRSIRSHYPKLKILLMSSMQSIAVIRSAFILGISGYISKRDFTQEYFRAIKMIANGKFYIPDDILADMLVGLGRVSHLNSKNEKNSYGPMVSNDRLTSREIEILGYFLNGLSIKEIAGKLCRSYKTISCHKQKAMKKLGFISDAELFKYKNDLLM